MGTQPGGGTDDGAPSRKLNRALRKLYYTPEDPGSFGGVEKLFRRANEVGVPGVTRDVVRKFLTDQQTYSLHKQARKHFRRNRTYVSGIDVQWQADLADMQALSRDNDGIRYILVVIDVFSKYGWAIPVKNKYAKTIAKALRDLLEQPNARRPLKLQTDKGTEFFNKEVRDLLQQHDIKHFHSWSDKKAAVAERFIRTLKGRLYKYFTQHQTRRYIEVLPRVLEGYNLAVHRAIGMRPADVRKEHETKLWRRLYENVDGGRKAPAIPPGQKVRVSTVKGQFEKGYTPNWSEEHFLIRGEQAQPRKTYKLRDYGGEDVHGAWYPEELQPIEQNRYVVEKILRRRKAADGVTREALVQWKGWDSKFNTWIAEDDLENLA